MTKKSDIVNTCCILCGDTVELNTHRVCFWHAICIKNKNGDPTYAVEAEYAMEHFSDVPKYMERVNYKKKQILEAVNRLLM